MTQLLAAAADEAVVERVVLEPFDCPTAPYGLVDEYLRGERVRRAAGIDPTLKTTVEGQTDGDREFLKIF